MLNTLTRSEEDVYRKYNKEQFRFARVPFGSEASPFTVEATLEHHYDQQSGTVSGISVLLEYVLRCVDVLAIAVVKQEHAKS